MSNRESPPAKTVTRPTFVLQGPRRTLAFSSDLHTVVVPPSKLPRTNAGRYSMVASEVTS